MKGNRGVEDLEKRGVGRRRGGSGKLGQNVMYERRINEKNKLVLYFIKLSNFNCIVILKSFKSEFYF